MTNGIRLRDQWKIDHRDLILRHTPRNLQEDQIVDLEDMVVGDDKGEISGDVLAWVNEDPLKVRV